MATVAVTLKKESNRDIEAVWTPLTTTDTDGGIVTSYENRYGTVAFTGTFGAGGSVKLEGSIDGTNYFTLVDHSGTDIVFTAAGMITIRDIVKYYRPVVTAGDGTTSLTCNLLLR